MEHNLLKYDVVKNLETLDIVETPNSDKHLVGDLNFMKLPKERYDIIICKGSLHHIINLEHLLNQVNKSSKKDGFFVLLEYVGENKWQWSDDKIKFINNQFRKEFSTSNSIKIEKNKDILWNEVPFESIRSFQIPNLIIILGKIKHWKYYGVEYHLQF